MTRTTLDALAAQAKNGVVCVRSSRVVTGRVGRNVEVNDEKLGLVASDDLNPQRARVLLRLALLKPPNPAERQRFFQEYRGGGAGREERKRWCPVSSGWREYTHRGVVGDVRRLVGLAGAPRSPRVDPT